MIDFSVEDICYSCLDQHDLLLGLDIELIVKKKINYLLAKNPMETDDGMTNCQTEAV